MESNSLENKNAINVLKNLVDALNSTYWSSWQSTAKFDDQLTKAEEFLETHGDKK